MKLEAQVVSLDLAKKLKALNVKQESYFYHCKEVDSTDEFLIGQELIETCGFEKVASAWTVAELGEMLPVHHCSGQRSDGDWRCFDFEKLQKWEENPSNRPIVQVREKTEADARAKMLIYLLESNLAPKSIKGE